MKKAVLAASLLVLLIFASGCLQPKACEEGKARACTLEGCDGTQTCVNGKWGGCIKTDACCGGGCGQGEATYPFGFAGPTQPPDNFNKIAEVGANYIRESIVWGGTDPVDFSNMDTAYDKLKNQYGLKPIVRLKLKGPNTKCDTSLTCPDAPIYTTCPASSADCPPADLGGWSERGYSPMLYDSIYGTIEHFFNTNRPIEYIIVGNEVNTLLFWHASSEDYLKTRGTVFKAVHDFDEKNNQDVKVVDNGFAGGVWGFAILRDEVCSGDPARREFAEEFASKYFRRRFTQTQMEDYINNNFKLPYFCANPDISQIILRDSFKIDPNLGEASFDYMAYHFYEPWDTQQEIINWIEKEMQKNGYQKPIMHTEGGYSDNLRLLDNPVVADEVRKDVADDIPKLHVIAFANGVKTWLWLPFTERYDSAYYGPTYSGLFDPNQQELPAFRSYKTMTQKLTGFTSVQKIDFGEYTYKFIVDGKPVYVLWRSEDTAPNPITVDLSSEISGYVKVTGVDGTIQTVPGNALQVTESPIYVEVV